MVVFDKVGQGYTDNPDRAEEYVFETVVAHAFAFADRLGLDGCHVVGHSRGGVVAARMTIEPPECVRGLVLVDTGSVAPLDPGVPVGTFYAPLEGDRLWSRRAARP